MAVASEGPMTEAQLEFATPRDAYLDYCLWEYAPPAAPDGKLRSVNLLYNSFELADDSGRMRDLCAAIREGIGPFRTVWSVRQVEDRLTWEFYFYDYRRLERERSIEKLIEVIRPFLDCRLSDRECRPYFMFSIDFDNALMLGRRSLDEINVYLGNVGSSVSSGICYSLTAEGLALQNFYFFFDARTQLQDIVGKIACSAYLDLPNLDMSAILWPELRRCKTIVVANKKRNDGIYYSRVDIDQLLFFVRKLGYPDPLVSFITVNRERLDHLLYDVGFDYVMEDGKIRILKSGYYGVF